MENTCKDCKSYIDRLLPAGRKVDGLGDTCVFYCSNPRLRDNYSNFSICTVFEPLPKHILLWKRKLNEKSDS